MSAEARRAAKLARSVNKLARRTAAHDRQEEDRFLGLARRAQEARLLAPLAEPTAPEPAARVEWPRRRALLIVNSKSGPHKDSLLRIRDMVDLLAVYNIRAELRVKIRKSQARREARAAAARGFPLVIAAGGDGTIEAVAAGLLGTDTALGIIALGTYNNVATCLGIPTDMAAACALIASGSPRAIDAGQVEVSDGKGGKKRRAFFETSAVGLGAALTSAGQHAEKGRWTRATRALPLVMGMPPTSTQIRLDGGKPHWSDTLLITVSNAPRGGAGLHLAPEAHMDDGLLDVCVYDRLEQTALASKMLALKNGGIGDDPSVHRTRAISVTIRSARPLPVAADSKLIGVTPARFTIQPGALLALVGPGPGLARPAPSLVADLSAEMADAVVDGALTPTQAELPAPQPDRTIQTIGRAGLLALPIAAALVFRALRGRRR
jgi:diacylglycerol kinase (ATP)